MGIFKMPIGPFRMLDGVGLDTAWHITDYWAGRTGDAQLRRNAAFLKRYLDRGCVGVKSGEGFYRYPSPAFARPDFVTSGTKEVESMRSAAPPPAALAPSPRQVRPWAFHGQRGITVAFPPADPVLYRRFFRRCSTCLSRRSSSSLWSATTTCTPRWCRMARATSSLPVATGAERLVRGHDACRRPDGVRQRPVDRLPQLHGRSHRAGSDDGLS